MNAWQRVCLAALFVCLPSQIAGQDIPSSPRSVEAVARVKPGLEARLARQGFHWGSPIFIRIFKRSYHLELWCRDTAGFRRFKTYPVCSYGGAGLGPKTRAGDGKAPEGFYFVTPSRLNPLSRFHLAFNLGYPNRYDRHHGRTGSALMVHGRCVSIGCFAMTDGGIEEIFALADAALQNGQRFFRVHIFPFRLTDRNMEAHVHSQWFDFWQNLKEGYDYFETRGHTPPNVEVISGRYVFGPP